MASLTAPQGPGQPHSRASSVDSTLSIIVTPESFKRGRNMQRGPAQPITASRYAKVTEPVDVEDVDVCSECGQVPCFYDLYVRDPDTGLSATAYEAMMELPPTMRERVKDILSGKPRGTAEVANRSTAPDADAQDETRSDADEYPIDSVEPLTAKIADMSIRSDDEEKNDGSTVKAADSSPVTEFIAESVKKLRQSETFQDYYSEYLTRIQSPAPDAALGAVTRSRASSGESIPSIMFNGTMLYKPHSMFSYVLQRVLPGQSFTRNTDTLPTSREGVMLFDARQIRAQYDALNIYERAASLCVRLGPQTDLAAVLDFRLQQCVVRGDVDGIQGMAKRLEDVVEGFEADVRAEQERERAADALLETLPARAWERAAVVAAAEGGS